ncbi:MAG: hypothetical protein ACLQD9_03580 [Thermoplasmata archaeon]
MRVVLKAGGPISREELFGQLLGEGFGLRSIGLALARGIRRGGVIVVKIPAGFVAYGLEERKGRVVKIGSGRVAKA